MNKFLEIFLGILTAMGGFVEIGELVFMVNAGTKFRFSLLWVVVLGTVGIIVYGEIAGRIAAVAKKPVFAVMRERLGYRTALASLVAANIVNLMTCAAEIGGVAFVLKLLFGGNYYLLVVCSAIFLLLVVAFFALEWIERIFGLLGLMMIVYIASAANLVPDWHAVAAGFVPSVPTLDKTSDHYLFAYFVVAMMSSIMMPYETYFYASGAIEDKWKPSDINMNRVIIIIGSSLGSLLAIALLLIGASVFAPLQIDPQLPGTAALASAMVYGKWGLILALSGMFFAFCGAAIETTLSAAYNAAQLFDWPWGKSKPMKQVPRFTAAWVIMFVLALGIIITGVDPVEVVEYSIIFAVLTLPLTYLPLMLASRDADVMGKYVNGRLASVLGWAFLVIITIAALAAIPLLIITHGGKG